MFEVFTPVDHEFANDDFGVDQYPEVLSKNEVGALDLFSRGLSLDGIAAQLYVAPNTVRHYIRTVHVKYGVTSTAHATRVAIERGDLSFTEDIEAERSLSEVEFKSLELASLGFTAVEAAIARNVSVNTLRTHNRTIKTKLQARTIVEAVRRGFELGYFNYPVKDSGVSALSVMALMSSLDKIN